MFFIEAIIVLGANRRFKRVLELIQIQLQAFLYEPQSKPEGKQFLKKGLSAQASANMDDKRLYLRCGVEESGTERGVE